VREKKEASLVYRTVRLNSTQSNCLRIEHYGYFKSSIPPAMTFEAQRRIRSASCRWMSVVYMAVHRRWSGLHCCCCP